MGNLGDLIPPREDHELRLQRDLERRQQEEAAARRGARMAIPAGGVLQVDGALVGGAALDDLEGLPTFGEASASTSGFGLSGSVSDVAVANLTVPPYKTRALVTLAVTGGVQNTIGGSGFSTLRVQARIGPALQGFSLVSIENGRYGTAPVFATDVIEGLTPGDSIELACSMSFTGSHSSTSARLSASAIFLR